MVQNFQSDSSFAVTVLAASYHFFLFVIHNATRDLLRWATQTTWCKPVVHIFVFIFIVYICSQIHVVDSVQDAHLYASPRS